MKCPNPWVLSKTRPTYWRRLATRWNPIRILKLDGTDLFRVQGEFYKVQRKYHSNYYRSEKKTHFKWHAWFVTTTRFHGKKLQNEVKLGSDKALSKASSSDKFGWRVSWELYFCLLPPLSVGPRLALISQCLFKSVSDLELKRAYMTNLKNRRYKHAILSCVSRCTSMVNGQVILYLWEEEKFSKFSESTESMI